MNDGQSGKTHVVIVPSPGMGHLIPLAEFAKRLVLHGDFSVSFMVPTIGPAPKAQQDFLASLPEAVHHVFLPPVSVDDLPKSVETETKVFLAVVRSVPLIRDALRSLATTARVAAMVIDVFGTEAMTAAEEFGIPSYVFFLSSAMTLALLEHLPKLDETVSGAFQDVSEPVTLPGCVPIQARDFPDPFLDRKADAYGRILQACKRMMLAQGILLNSFTDLEPEAIKALLAQKPSRPPVYPIGPLTQKVSGEGDDGSECLRWLESQPPGSVLFVSFGSAGTLSQDQIRELAMGLEMSEQRFLWVVRKPDDKSSKGAFFTVHSDSDPLAFLPEGFVERTRGRGLLVPSWAPQIKVLSHGATGGFLTHCGWNSILESVAYGVPLIAWPLYAEQKMNAVFLTEDAKVALRVRPAGKGYGLVGRDEISQAVKGLMAGNEGTAIRNRMQQLKLAAEKALAEDGSSTKAVSELMSNWITPSPANA